VHPSSRLLAPTGDPPIEILKVLFLASRTTELLREMIVPDQSKRPAAETASLHCNPPVFARKRLEEREGRAGRFVW
jgi:hypothetical protein